MVVVDPAAKREVGEKKSEAEYQLQLCHQRAEELGKEESEIRKASQEIKRKHVSLIFILFRTGYQ